MKEVINSNLEKAEALLKIVIYLVNSVLTPEQIEKVKTDLNNFGLSAAYEQVKI